MSAVARRSIRLPALAIALAFTLAASAQAAPATPSSDPFYSYSGDLSSIPRVASLSHRGRRLFLRLRGGAPRIGRYTFVVLVGRTRALRHVLRIRR